MSKNTPKCPYPMKKKVSAKKTDQISEKEGGSSMSRKRFLTWVGRVLLKEIRPPVQPGSPAEPAQGIHPGKLLLAADRGTSS